MLKSPPSSRVFEIKRTHLETAIPTLEAAHMGGHLPEDLQQRIDALSSTRAGMGKILSEPAPSI